MINTALNFFRTKWCQYLCIYSNIPVIHSHEVNQDKGFSSLLVFLLNMFYSSLCCIVNLNRETLNN